MSLFVAVPEEVDAVVASSTAAAATEAEASCAVAAEDEVATSPPPADVPSGVPGPLPIAIVVVAAVALIVPSPALTRSRELPRLSEVAPASIDFFSSPPPPSTDDNGGRGEEAFDFVAAFLPSSPPASATRPSDRAIAAIMLLRYHGAEERAEGSRARGSLKEEKGKRRSDRWHPLLRRSLRCAKEGSLLLSREPTGACQEVGEKTWCEGKSEWQKEQRALSHEVEEAWSNPRSQDLRSERKRPRERGEAKERENLKTQKKKLDLHQ